MMRGSTLASALRYAISAVEPVTPELLRRPTPCRGWDLGMLLAHACDSVAAIGEGVTGGVIALAPAADLPADPRHDFLGRAARPADPRQHFLGQASRLLARCEHEPGHGVVLVGGCPLAGGLLTAIGAIEIAMHGWDVSQARGASLPIPESLAGHLLPAARTLLCAGDRAQLFGPPQRVGATASASDQLAAFLGRIPGSNLAA
jgi:uncharacterized protein (TIGR03086 family)